MRVELRLCFVNACHLIPPMLVAVLSFCFWQCCWRVLGLLCGIRSYHFGSVRCGADSLHAGVFGAVVIAGGDNVTVECAADLFAVFEDGGLCAYLHNAVLKDFDFIDNYGFL
jgi:hypothetical protein